MINWRILPQNSSVAKYVECYWYLNKELGDVGIDYPKLNPDPSAHLVISESQQSYNYEQGTCSQSGKGSHWIFPHRGMFSMDHRGSFSVLGIKFKTGALYSCLTDFSKCKLEKILSFEVNQLFEDKLENLDLLIDQVEMGGDIACKMLDELFAPCLSSIKDDDHSDLVREILPLMNTMPIAQFGKALYRSQRTIERSFLRVTGLTLKQYQSMIRLEEILGYLFPLTKEKINWTDLAYKFEFSDQPHLIRYLKNIIGKTPNEYARDRDLTIDIYGDFEIH